MVKVVEGPIYVDVGYNIDRLAICGDHKHITKSLHSSVDDKNLGLFRCCIVAVELEQ